MALDLEAHKHSQRDCYRTENGEYNSKSDKNVSQWPSDLERALFARQVDKILAGDILRVHSGRLMKEPQVGKLGLRRIND